MKIGSLVELVDDTNWKNIAPAILPKRGIVYTVRGFMTVGGVNGIYLEEIKNRNLIGKYSKYEASFTTTRFRELQPPIANIEEHINLNSLEYEQV